MRDTPPTAQVPPSGISRRTFIQIGSALGAVAALTSVAPPSESAIAGVPAAAVTAERPHRTLLGVL
jgi:hypothetical protein